MDPNNPNTTTGAEINQKARVLAQIDEAYAKQRQIVMHGTGTAGQLAGGAARQEQAMCARETARMLIMHNIDRLDRERAGLVALLDYLHPNMHVFAPQADEALFEMVSRRR